MNARAGCWQDAAAAAAVFAVDPASVGGIVVRSGVGPVRDRWMDVLRGLLPPAVAIRKLPVAIADDRLLGGIDLAATLLAGRPVAARGLLAEAHGGILLAVMAERIAPATAARLAAVLDARELSVERDGLSQRYPASFGIVALDEGLDDERMPASLCDRLALQLDLWPFALADVASVEFTATDIADARRRLPDVSINARVVEILCHTAVALGVVSLRVPALALRVARAAAALDGSAAVARPHIECAARLVLAPRATCLPQSDPQQQASEQPAQDRKDEQAGAKTPMEDLVLAAAQAAIPPDLLKRLQGGALHAMRTPGPGRQGAASMGLRRGRPLGARRGPLVAGARLHVLETLRTAAPWQTIRRSAQHSQTDRETPFLIRKEDFRVVRFKQRSMTSTIFVVDASGSSALQRLAEVKGAVNLLLADCYARRDEVALIAFRGQTAELILPPTRSLTLAKRRLAALPGGGGTPLSMAILSATALAVAVRGKGRSPTVVLMTDGRANVTRDGSGGRSAAEAEAQEAARSLRVAAVPAIVIDTSPRPQPHAERIAAEMQARYVALPYADAARLSRTVQANMQAR